MLFTTHLCVGALIGRYTNPVPALVTGAVSHLVLDRVPHWGNPDPQAFLRAARIDGLTALGVAALLLWQAPVSRRAAVLAGMVGAGLPDMDKPGRHFLGFSPYPEAFDRFHAGIQQGIEAPGNIWTDAATGIAAFLFIAASADRLPASGLGAAR